jgi:hypothetical protein
LNELVKVIAAVFRIFGNSRKVEARKWQQVLIVAIREFG